MSIPQAHSDTSRILESARQPLRTTPIHAIVTFPGAHPSYPGRGFGVTVAN